MIPVTKAGEMRWLTLEAANGGKGRSLAATLVLVDSHRLWNWELETKISLAKDLLSDVSLAIRKCPQS